MTIRDIIEKIEEFENDNIDKSLDYHEGINDMIVMLYDLEKECIFLIKNTALRDIFEVILLMYANCWISSLHMLFWSEVKSFVPEIVVFFFLQKLHSL